ncbi:Kinesin-like protein kif27 [Entophlyctis luteolus]|nr:Kinesin-like protein kif27 [Entophlyctis luteolus]
MGNSTSLIARSQSIHPTNNVSYTTSQKTHRSSISGFVLGGSKETPKRSAKTSASGLLARQFTSSPDIAECKSSTEALSNRVPESNTAATTIHVGTKPALPPSVAPPGVSKPAAQVIAPPPTTAVAAAAETAPKIPPANTIEEFTCLMAFGVHMDVAHPSLVRPASHSTADTAAGRSYTAQDIIGQVRERHVASEGPEAARQASSRDWYSMDEIITAFGIATPHSSSDESGGVREFVGSGGLESFLRKHGESPNTDSPGTTRVSRSSVVSFRLDNNSSSSKGSAKISGFALEEAERLQLEIPRFEREIKYRMHPVVYHTGEYIIRKHEIGHEMFFLSKGTVEVVSADGGTVYSMVHSGAFFGELGVLFNVPRTASVRASDDCYCMVLTRENLEEVLKRFPIIESRFRQVAEKRMAELRKMISYKQMLEFQQKMDVVAGIL